MTSRERGGGVARETGRQTRAPSGRGAWTAPAFALILLGHAALTSSFWQLAGQALSGASYLELREEHAFVDVDLDGIRARLDAVVPIDAPVALPPEVQAEDLSRQRFTEMLYPRRIDPQARLALVLRGGRDADPANGIPLGRARETHLYLRLPPDASAPLRPSPPLDDPFRLSWTRFAAVTAGLWGIGFGLLRAGRRFGFDLGRDALAAALPFGGLAVCLCATIATWFQVAVPWFAVGLLGLAPFFYAVVNAAHRCLAGRHDRHPPACAPPALRAREVEGGIGSGRAGWLEIVVPLGFALVVLLRFTRLPILQWDGRSIWLFNAKRLLTRGTLSASDILDGTVAWSHPDYPLFFPAWLAMYSSLSASFNERMASLGIAALLAAALLLLAQLLREVAGRGSALALTLVLALDTDKVVAGGYADAFLTLVLLVAFLAFCDPQRQCLAWTAAAIASLLKTEGVVLAASLAIALALFAPHLRSRPPARRFLPFLCFLPAIVHQLWMTRLGAHSLAVDQTAAGALGAFLPRLAESLGASGRLWITQGYLHLRALYWQALLAAVVSVALAGVVRPDWRVRALLAGAALQVAFAYVAIALLPQGATWFVETALDRLLLHPAALLLTLPLLQLGAPSPGPARAEPCLSPAGRSPT